MARNVQAVQEEHAGVIGGVKRSHPAFGCIEISRPQGGHNSLFGSDVIHNSYIQLTINTATERYDAGYKSHMAQDEIVQVKMTADQWARMVSAIGIGSGTPCTIEWIRGEGYMPSIPDPTLGEEHKRSISQYGEKAVNAARAMIDTINNLLSHNKISAKAAKELGDQAHRTISVINDSMPFVVENAQERVEQVVADAKSTVEAHFRQIVYTEGLTSLSEKGIVPALTKVEVK